MEYYINAIIAILTGLVTAIPLVIQLVKYVKEAIRGKNYSNVMALVMSLMAEAEEKYSEGAQKKEYVMGAIKSMEKTLNYDIDEKAISVMIDSLVDITKKINVK